MTGLLLTVVVTATSIQDRDAGHRLLAMLRGTFFRGPAAVGRRRLPGTPARLDEKWSSTAGRHHQTQARLYRIPRPTPSVDVERTFAWLNKYRRCVRDYEAKPERHEAMVLIATIATMTRRLART
ncbi:hypothetical protein ACHMZP_32565 [Rhodococcus baikonurensis]|uniref:hypothetical protein n=1 Tax=Rhodococcus baikonurensis TaxID=172041 RepID=UPI0037B4F142